MQHNFGNWKANRPVVTYVNDHQSKNNRNTPVVEKTGSLLIAVKRDRSVVPGAGEGAEIHCNGLEGIWGESWKCSKIGLL